MEILIAVRKFWAVLNRTTRLRVILLLTAMAFAAFLELVGLSTIPVFLGVLARQDSVATHPLLVELQAWLPIETRRDFFQTAAILLAFAFTIQTGYLASLAFFKARFVSHVINEISQRLFAGYLRAPLAFHQRQHSASASSKIALESMRTANQFSFPLLHMVQSGLLMSAIIVFVIVMSPLSAILVLLGVAAAATMFLVAMRRRASAYGRTLTHQNAKLLEDVGEALGCLKHVRLRGLESNFEAAFARDSKARADALGFQRFVNEFPKPLLEGMAVIGLIIIVFAILGSTRDLEGIVPALGLIGAAVARVLPHINQFTTWILSLYQNASSAQALADELDELDRIAPEPAPDDESASSTAPLFQNAVDFENVSYHYEGGHDNSVENVSFKIEKNMSVAIAGPTGAGKSTIIDLFCGLTAPSAGTIRVDGRDMNEIRRQWHRHIGYIPQAIFLANRSLRENVALGLRPAEIDDARVWTVLGQAQIDDFVRDLPEGLDTHVGENGVRLSGGQRQRIGIARALYHDPDVLVLDEATAALDSDTERRLMASIEQVRANRTIVMIAHRLSSIRNCDRIFVMEDGHITGAGTFNQLLRCHTNFRAMAA